MPYRPDIDGLRAIAVLLVVVFHAAPSWLPGGFIGVDIFFVISGYLITSIITSEMRKGEFSFLSFYSRRVRRIFPALGLVLLTCLASGWWFLMSGEYAQLGKHVAAGAGFLSNIALWRESGYFDQDATLKPLLHLWSLGVEEQFYFLWPLVLWTIWRNKWPMLPTVGILLALSFASNLWASRQDAAGAYYLPWNRFWEILSGALIAHAKPYLGALIAQGNVSSLGRHVTQAVSGVGALSVLLATFLITEESRFPGWWALLPVLGGVFIVAAGPDTWVNRLLAWRPLVLIGLISYPLYLWHWPLLSFAHILYGYAPPPIATITALILAFAMSAMTYLLLELPLRRGQNQMLLTWSLIATLGAMGAFGAWIFTREGVVDRANAQPQVIYPGDTYHHEIFNLMTDKFHVCTPKLLADQADRWEGHVRCMQTRATDDVDIALVGDSHAEHLFLGLAEQYPLHNIAYYLKVGPAFDGNPAFADIFDHVEQSRTIKHVVLTMSWQRRVGKVPKESTLAAEILTVARRFMATGKKVYITTDVPHFSFDPNRCRLQRPLALDAAVQCSADLPANPDILNALSSVIAQEPGIQLIDTYPYFCAGLRCSMVQENQLLYRDRTHLNILGSRYIGQRIREAYPNLFAETP